MAKPHRRRFRKDEVKPLSEGLREQARTFYQTVGIGITTWSEIEGRLVQLVAKLLRTSETKAGLVMYSIINFNVWIDIIEELFELDGYSQSLAEWKKIAGRLRNENSTRARLAHHSIDQDITEIERTGGVQAYLLPGRLDVRKKWKTLEPLDAVGILKFCERVHQLDQKLIILLTIMETEGAARDP